MIKPLVSSLFAGLVLSAASLAATAAEYEISITNLTPGQSFTPQLALSHAKQFKLFTPGKPASVELEMLAEGGDTAPLSAAAAPYTRDSVTNAVLLGPGETTTLTIKGKAKRHRLSLAAMLIPTNDTFIALNSVKLPRFGSRTFHLPAYDAGTEYNDQNCAHIPGPRCGGEGYSPSPSADDEGFVHIGNGFHDLGGSDENGNEILGPKVYDWRNFVAKITVTRVH